MKILFFDEIKDFQKALLRSPGIFLDDEKKLQNPYFFYDFRPPGFWVCRVFPKTLQKSNYLEYHIIIMIFKVFISMMRRKKVIIERFFQEVKIFYYSYIPTFHMYLYQTYKRFYISKY